VEYESNKVRPNVKNQMSADAVVCCCGYLPCSLLKGEDDATCIFTSRLKPRRHESLGQIGSHDTG
jgi:hypothetical protein